MSMFADYSYSGYDSQIPRKGPVSQICSYSLKLDDTNYQDLFLKKWLVLAPLFIFLQHITSFILSQNWEIEFLHWMPMFVSKLEFKYNTYSD